MRPQPDIFKMIYYVHGQGDPNLVFNSFFNRQFK